MRCLERNKQIFWFAPLEGKEAQADEYGNLTGEYILLRGKPQECKANISAAQGELELREFGEDEAYDKVVVYDNNGPSIDEYTVLWVDRKPVIETDGTTNTPYDYIVRKVAKSLNSTALAISKVSVSNGKT